MEKTNLNVATESDLCLLPGIGKAMAKRILAHREAVYRFDSVEQLLDIKGFGRKKLDDLAWMVCAEDAVEVDEDSEVDEVDEVDEDSEDSEVDEDSEDSEVDEDDTATSEEVAA